MGPNLFSSTVLLTDFSDSLSDKFQRVHNMCIRYISNIRRYEHISPSLQHLSWLRLNDRRIFQSLVLIFQIFHTLPPYYLPSRFHFLSSNHNLCTQSQHNLTLNIPSHITALYSASYTVSSSQLWNSLPLEIRGCRTLPSFKTNLNNLLLYDVN